MPAPYTCPTLSYTTKTNKVDLVDAAHINTLQIEQIAQNNRLLNMIDADGSLASGPSYPSPSLPSQAFYNTSTDKLYLRNSTNTAWLQISPGNGIPSNMQVFTASGTWTRPAGVDIVYAKIWGGGGGGGATNGGGGGSGGYAEGLIAVTADVTVTIGAAGSGGVHVGGSGASGGNSTFVGTTTLTANGGAGGQTSSIGGNGGSASGGTINMTGFNGTSQSNGPGAYSPYGIGFGGVGIAPVGNNAGGYGAGGGGGNATNSGGAGTGGYCIIYWVQ